MAKLRNKDSTENWSHKNDYPIEEFGIRTILWLG